MTPSPATDVYASGRQVTLPTAAEALKLALEAAAGGRSTLAEAYTAIARELREGSRPPRGPAGQLTLHDIEGIVCAHGRIAVRRKNANPAGWFLHTDDGSNCDEAQPETEHKRRMSADVAAVAHERWIFDTQATVKRQLDLFFDGKEAPPPAAATQQLQPVPAVNPPREDLDHQCRNCPSGTLVRWIAGRGWVHLLTLQAACVRPIGKGHQPVTFAEPMTEG